MLRLFFRAQYKANMAPLINDITRMAKATPDIHVVAHAPAAGSVLLEKKKQLQLITCGKLKHLIKIATFDTQNNLASKFHAN